MPTTLLFTVTAPVLRTFVTLVAYDPSIATAKIAAVQFPCTGLIAEGATAVGFANIRVEADFRTLDLGISWRIEHVTFRSTLAFAYADCGTRLELSLEEVGVDCAET